MLEEWNWTIGEIVAPFGRVGEVKVRLETDFPERFAALKEVCLRPRTGEPRLFEIRRARLHKGQAILLLRGIESIDDAERWRGAWVQIPRNEAVPLERGSFYRADLLGLDVVTVGGRRLGKIDDVLAYPAHDLLQVGEALIPAVRPIVVEVDLGARRVIVDPPAGLLPDEEPEHAN